MTARVDGRVVDVSAPAVAEDTDSAWAAFVVTPLPFIPAPAGTTSITSEFVVSVPSQHTAVQAVFDTDERVTFRATDDTEVVPETGARLFHLTYASPPGRHSLEVRGLSDAVAAPVWERFEWTVDASTPTLTMTKAPSSDIPACVEPPLPSSTRACAVRRLFAGPR